MDEAVPRIVRASSLRRGRRTWAHPQALANFLRSRAKQGLVRWRFVAGGKRWALVLIHERPGQTDWRQPLPYVLPTHVAEAMDRLRTDNAWGTRSTHFEDVRLVLANFDLLLGISRAAD